MTKLVESLEKLQNKHPSNPDPWSLVYLYAYCLSYTVIVCSYTLYMSVLHVAIWNERNKNCSHCRLYNELFNTPSSMKITAMVSLRYLINVILALDNIFRSKNRIENLPLSVFTICQSFNPMNIYPIDRIHGGINSKFWGKIKKKFQPIGGREEPLWPGHRYAKSISVTFPRSHGSDYYISIDSSRDCKEKKEGNGSMDEKRGITLISGTVRPGDRATCQGISSSTMARQTKV